jgi:Na+-transporting NADH:ubiquinone oxidoreductase subunit NqrF
MQHRRAKRVDFFSKIYKRYEWDFEACNHSDWHKFSLFKQLIMTDWALTLLGTTVQRFDGSA